MKPHHPLSQHVELVGIKEQIGLIFPLERAKQFIFDLLERELAGAQVSEMHKKGGQKLMAAHVAQERTRSDEIRIENLCQDGIVTFQNGNRMKSLEVDDFLTIPLQTLNFLGERPAIVF